MLNMVEDYNKIVIKLVSDDDEEAKRNQFKLAIKLSNAHIFSSTIREWRNEDTEKIHELDVFMDYSILMHKLYKTDKKRKNYKHATRDHKNFVKTLLSNNETYK